MKIFQVLMMLCFFSAWIQADPLLVAVLMVKNEEISIEMTLQPLVDAGIKDFLIYDTGSVDRTVFVALEFFIQNNISNFVIEQDTWVDFATSRNRALRCAEQYFPDATFMLMLDAEWILCNGARLLEFCKAEEHKSSTLYLIRLIGPLVDFYHARLIRCRSNIEFFGKVHEVPTIPAQNKVPHDIYFALSPTHYGAEKTKARWQRDKELLLQELEEKPENPRIIYYLAQTYLCLQDWDNAIKLYEQRTTMQGWDEETYMAYLMLAQAYWSSGNAEKMICNYLKAFAVRPHRVDSLIRLAEYYYSIGSYATCFLFAKYAITAPYPYDDFSPIDKQAYDFIRYNLVSATAHLFHEFKLGKQATEQALKVYPNAEYLHTNLKFYQMQLDKR